MDLSNNNQRTNGQGGYVQQSNNNLNHFENYIDGLNPYGDDLTTPVNNDGNFDLTWPDELFPPGPSPSAFQQSGAIPQSFDPNGTQNHSSSSLFDGGIQSTLSPNPFGQRPSFENNSMSQSSYNPNSMPRPTPSPQQYGTYSFQQPMNYPGRAQMLSPSNFNASSGMISQHQQQPQRTPSSMGQSYNASAGHPIYQNLAPQSLDPRQMHQQGYQPGDLSNYGIYPEQTRQPSSQFVNPHMLNSTGSRGGNTMPLQYQSQQQFANSLSPYLSSIYSTDQLNPQVSQPPAQQVALKQASASFPGSGIGLQTSVNIPPKQTKPKVPKDPNAPKKPRGRPRKHTSGSDSESDSEDSLQIEEEEPEITPAPLVVSPPTDPKARAIYDAVSAVWSPRNLPAILEKVQAGVKLYGDTVRKLRDSWKPENEALTAAENANSVEKVAVLKERVEAYRDTMKRIMDRTLLYGHPEHLKNLPLNMTTLTAFNSFLLDRFKRDDFDAPLVTSMLKAKSSIFAITYLSDVFQVLGTFTLMGEDKLEQSKLLKIIQRLAKKGGTESKALAQKVLDNAALATTNAKSLAQAVIPPPSPKVTNGNASVHTRPASQIVPQKNDSVVGVKRPREAEADPLPAVKKATATKPITQASKPLAVQQAERRKLELAQQKLKTEKTGTNSPSAPPAKPKVTVVSQPKPTTSVFASLMSASKKPGTTNADRAAAAKTKPTSVSTTKKEDEEESTPVSSTASKSSFSFLEALQGMDKPKEVQEKKADDRPAETDEERKTRLRKEDRRKLRVSWKPDDSLVQVRVFTHDPDEEQGHADSMMRDVGDVGGEGRMLKLHLHEQGLEEEEDEGEDIHVFRSPSEVDLSEYDDEWQRGANFLKMGGKLLADSPASDAQKRHEDSTVMVVYAIPSDQPISPKEPPADEDDYEPDLPTSFGEPLEVREKEEKWLANRPPERQAPPLGGGVDINAILQIMQKTQPAQQTSISPELQRTLSMLGGQQQQTPQAPAQAPAPAAGSDLTNLLAVVNSIKAQQPQFAATPAAGQATNTAPNLAAIMAAMQAQNPILPVGSHNNPNPFSGADNDHSRKHSRNEASVDDQDDYSKKNKKKKGTERPYNYKTVPCGFWQKGQCIKGDNCTYRHDE